MNNEEIYYMNQDDWCIEDFDYLNSFFCKIFSYKNKEKNKNRIKSMNLNKMSDKTKAILKSYLCQQKILDQIIKEFPNLKDINKVKPLKEKLILSKTPFNIFKEYEKMNIIM
mgnify:CR=1 FL=1